MRQKSEDNGKTGMRDKCLESNEKRELKQDTKTENVTGSRAEDSGSSEGSTRRCEEAEDNSKDVHEQAKDNVIWKREKIWKKTKIARRSSRK